MKHFFLLAFLLMHKSQMFVTFLDDEEYEEEKHFFWLTSVFVTEKNFVLFWPLTLFPQVTMWFEVNLGTWLSWFGSIMEVINPKF